MPGFDPLSAAVGATATLIGVAAVRRLGTRRPVRLDAEQRRLHKLVFPAMSAEQCKLVLAAARTMDAEIGEKLRRADASPGKVCLLVRGMAVVRLRGDERSRLSPGRFFGETSWFTQQATEEEVVATEPVRYLLWTREGVASLFSKRPELRPLFDVAVARDLAARFAQGLG